MSLASRREYLRSIHGRHQRPGRGHKTKILELLSQERFSAAPPGVGRSRPNAGPVYRPETLLPARKTVWLASEQLCSKRLRAPLPEWLVFLPQLDRSVRCQLLCASPATLDRLLRPLRVRYPRKGLSTTKPGKLLRHHIPLRDGRPDTAVPGHIKADTVAHCGDSTAGDFIYRPGRRPGRG